jgi:NAD(P)-dependent dehydrogenase (short-subunit alcohol dehydrogenase family)
LDFLVLWAVVNNAGILTSVGPHDWLRIEDYQFAIDINLYGVIRVTEVREKCHIAGQLFTLHFICTHLGLSVAAKEMQRPRDNRIQLLCSSS